MNKRKKTFKSQIMPCSRKSKGCDFELKAVRSDLENGTIHVYTHSQHNHSLMKLMPDTHPPQILKLPDNTEWKFLGTLLDYDKLQKLRIKNHTFATKRNEKSLRIRFYCYRRSSHQCKFMLLALKTTKQGYHVYKRGEHNNHLSLKQRSK
jgi:hypothetical protein